ncbi:hypothetical protein GF357_00805 [Candidatus Dojkabacteria bacterium]|nr:hypothetical protein [Candidatus Dojkabacteria bacterium]
MNLSKPKNGPKNSMNKTQLSNFNHKVTLLGGQTFSWELADPKNSTYIGVTQNYAIKARFEKKYLYWQTYPEKDNFSLIKSYFRLDEDYQRILSNIGHDKFVKKAMLAVPNIRLLRQPFDQTTLSFIISANNNITAIRKSINHLRRMLGDKIDVDGQDVFLFPKTDVIANTDKAKLRETKIGYRDKYISKTAKLLVEQDLAGKITKFSEEKARKHTLALPGVGNKVSDCILIFALGFENLSPIDVWTKRFLTDLYNLPANWSYEQFRAWVKDNFHGYASWANQFLFEWYRNAKAT